MKKINFITLIASVLIAILISSCADSLSACPEINGQKASFFSAAGVNGSPFAICSGYIFVNEESCPSVAGWTIAQEGQFTNSIPNPGDSNNDINVTGMFCSYKQ